MNRLLLALSLLATLLAGLASPVVAAAQAQSADQLLGELGLRLAGMKNQICSTTTGEPLFAHCLYVR